MDPDEDWDAQHEEWVHEQYIGIVAANWAPKDWYALAALIRGHHYSVIWAADPEYGTRFTKIWQNNWTLVEEVKLAGEAALAV